MSRLLQIILGLVGLVVVLVLAAVIIIPLVVDPNDYRDRIAAAVEEETGRSFEIEGELSLSVFPWLGLEVGRMRLGNPPGFGDAPFAEIASAGVGAKLMPLLSRRLEISTLRLDGLRLNLVQLADGTNNWDDLGDENGAAAEPSPRPDDAGAFRLERVDGLRITDAIIRYEDRAAGTVVEAAIPKLSTGELAPGKAFPLEAEASLRFAEGAMTVDATLDARVALAGAVLELERFGLDFELRGDEVPGGRQAGRLSMPRLTADFDAETLAIDELTAELAGVRASADVAGTRIVAAPSFTGRIAVQEFSPRALLERLGEVVPPTADDAVLRSASLAARYRIGAEDLELDELRVVLDDSTLSGTSAIGFAAITRIRAELALDSIDLDRYLAPEPDEPVETAPAEDVELAFDWLEGLDLDASLRADRLKVTGLTFTDLEARAVAQNGVLTLQPFGAALYGGQVNGMARLDSRQSPATFRLEQSLAALQLAPFVQDLAGFDRLTGIAQLDARLSTTASSTAELMSGLSGEIEFDLLDGALQGVNLWYEIQRANALARGRAVPERTSRDTDFRQLKGTAVIRDGLLVNEDLVGGLPFLLLTGRGEIDLAQAALDYRLNASVIREAIDEATGERSELAGSTLPLRLSGSLDSPSVSVDLGGLVRDRIQQEALDRLGIDAEAGRSVEEELKEQAQDKLRGLRERLRRDN